MPAPPYARQVPGRHDRIGRQAVDLRRVKQQEERAVAAGTVAGVGAVQPGLRSAGLVQLGQPAGRAFPQLAHWSELDRIGRADVQAGRMRAVLAHVRGHQPADVTVAGLLLLDERDGCG
jgi:hypothetical protein